MKKTFFVLSVVLILVSSLLVGRNNDSALKRDIRNKNIVKDTITVAHTVKDTKKEEIEKFIIIDASGNKVIFKKKPERIVPISYSIALIMNELGIEIVAMTSTKRYLPNKLKNIPEVGNPMRPNIEKIIEVKADLVIMNPRFLERHKKTFKEYGISYLALKNDTYQETKELIKNLGKAFGAEKKANQILEDFNKREKIIFDKIKDKKRPKVMVMYGAGSNFLLARETSFTGSLVKLLGGINVANSILSGNNLSAYVPFSLEKIVELNPDVILRVSHGTAEQTRKMFQKEFSKNPVWNQIKAVKNGRVYDLDNNLFFANPGLKAIDALEYLANILYSQNLD